MGKFSSRIIAWGIVFSLVLADGAHAQISTTFSATVILSQGATGHITNKELTPEEQKKVQSLDQKHVAPQKNESPPVHRQRVHENLNNPKTKKEYKELGVVSVYDGKREIGIADTPADLGTADKDGTKKAYYYPEGNFDNKPVKITIHTDINTYTEAFLYRPPDATIKLSPEEEKERQNIGLPLGFFNPNHPDIQIHIYEAFFHPEVIEHETSHRFDDLYGLHTPFNERPAGGGVMLIQGEPQPSPLQEKLSQLAQKVNATGDQALLYSFQQMIAHLTFDYGFNKVSANFNRDQLSGAKLIESLVDIQSRFKANYAASELFAWTIIAKYPEWTRDFRFRPLTNEEQAAFSKGNHSLQTRELVRAFLLATEGHQEVQDSLSQHNILSPGPEDFARLIEYNSYTIRPELLGIQE